MSDPKQNQKKVFYALNGSVASAITNPGPVQMMSAHRKKDSDSLRAAERTALTLLDYSDLPLLIRARACMILGNTS